MTRRGVWKHHRGGLYWVLGTAYESTNGPRDGETVVVYLSMTTGRMHTRDERQFHERVHLDKTVCTPETCPGALADAPECTARDRFQYMGESVPIPAPMP